MDKNISYKNLNILLILGIIYLLFLMRNLWINAVGKFFEILLPFFISFTVAYSIYPFYKYLIDKKVPKVVTIIIILLTIIILIGITIYYGIPLFFNQVINLLFTLEDIIDNLANNYKINMEFIYEFINKFASKIIGYISNMVYNGTILNIFNKSIDYITKLIIIIIVSIYFLIDMDNIRIKIKNILIKYNKKIYYIVYNIDNGLVSYIKGLCILMLIQFFEYTLLFLFIGHPNYLLLGFLASVTTIIPVFGGLITNIIAIIIASTISTKLLILTTLITIIFPNIDSYIISPKVYGKTNQIPTLLSIFSVFAGSLLFGFIGIIIAIPVTIIIMCILKEYKQNNICENIK